MHAANLIIQRWIIQLFLYLTDELFDQRAETEFYIPIGESWITRIEIKPA